MKLQEYKELLLNQDLNTLELELNYYNLIKEFFRDNKKISYNQSLGERVKNTLNIEGVGEFSYFVCTPLSAERFSREYFTTCSGREFRYSNIKGIAIYNFCSLLRSYDESIVSWGLSWDKEKFVKAINKKWDKYFEELEKSLDLICGSPLEEVFLNNYSNKFNQSRATVFGGPKGKAIIWTTISGGYNIQQEHLRMFCKPLSENHIKEFGVEFK